MKRSLSKKELLRKRREIRELFFSRRHYSCKGMKLILGDNELGCTRLLVSPSRGYGNAVERNKARRLGKEVFRLHKHHIATNYDMAFVFFPGPFNYHARETQMLGLLKRAHVLS